MPGLRILGPYRSLLALPGARAFVAAGLLGRVTLSMLGLGAVLLVSGLTGSYALAGAVSAVLTLSSGGANPFLGRLADRHGQRLVLLAGTALNLAGTAGLLCAATLHAPAWTLFPPAVVAGVGRPPVGSFARTRWSALVGGTPRLGTALSLETATDEIVFVVGPVLAISLSTLVWPGAGLVAATVLAAAGCLWLAAQHGTAPTPVPRADGGGASALRVPALRVLVLVFAVGGVAFGGLDVAMVAFAGERGAPVAAGPLLAAVSCGSLVAGLLYGTVGWVRPLHQRFLLGLAGFAVAVVPVVLVSTIPAMAVAALLSGLAIAPTMVPGFGLVGSRVPAAIRTEGYTWVSTAIATGLSGGAYLTGWAAESAGSHRAFVVVVAAAWLALLAALASARVLARPGPASAASDGSDGSREVPLGDAAPPAPERIST